MQNQAIGLEMYARGRAEFEKKNYVEAFNLFSMAVENNVPEAYYDLASCYYFGNGVAQNYFEAFKLFSKAAENNILIAYYNLAGCYYLGHGVLQNYSEAFKLFSKAAENGVPEVNYYLGLFYYNGYGVETNIEKAKYYLKLAIDNNEACSKDAEKIFADIKKKEIFTEAYEQYKKENYVEAAKLFQQGADMGDAYAMFFLGHCYSNGYNNDEVAVKWFQKSVDTEETPAALYALANHYLNGWGVDEDETKAFKLYKKAAEMNYDLAQESLGTCYYHGYGTNIDYSTAAYWYGKAAEQGLSESQLQIGLCYYFGDGVSKDYKQAFSWFSKSAKQDDLDAQFMQGLCYYNGEGVTQNYSKAFDLFSKTAENDIPDSYYYLGLCYYNGYGVETNTKKAKDYLKLAVENDEINGTDAAKLLSEIEQKGIIEKPSSTTDKVLIEESVKNDKTSDNQDLSSEEDPMSKLNALIGLSGVKSEILNLTNFIKVQAMRKEKGLPTPPISLHFVFTGNPGTGKTTVARILAQIFKELGLLKKGHLVEVHAQDLVAKFVGHTAPQTHEKFLEALGGVLFIDEAYSLVSDSEKDFGKDAINTILQDMEDYRDEIIVIVAGYDSHMKDFIDSNPGLKSRFNRYIHFEDYTADELYEIFLVSCQKNEYVVNDEAKEELKNYFTKITQSADEGFGNGRFVRNCFEYIIGLQANRIANSCDITTEMLVTIEREDILAATSGI